jgi:hypothetical protein
MRLLLETRKPATGGHLCVKLPTLAISLNTEQIFSQKVAIRLTQVAPICWDLVFALFRVG